MKDFEKWGQGKPAIVVWFARQVAMAADTAVFVAKTLHTGKGLDRFGKVPPGRTWARLYHQHGRLMRWLARAFTGNDESAQQWMRAWRLWLWWSRVSASQREAWLRAHYSEQELVAEWTQGREMMRQAFAEQVEELRQDASGQRDVSDVEPLMGTAEMQFLLRVWFPCMFLYGEYPGQLLRKARTGDPNALEKILRLDKGVIFDRGIANELHQAGSGERRVRFQRLAAAFKGFPKKVSAKRIKVNLGALISKLGKAVHHDIDAAEIRALFDSVARAMSKGKVRIDTDFPGAPETLRRELYSQRQFWHVFPAPEQNRA